MPKNIIFISSIIIPYYFLSIYVNNAGAVYMTSVTLILMIATTLLAPEKNILLAIKNLKWYGFSLLMVGVGFVVYSPGKSFILNFLMTITGVNFLLFTNILGEKIVKSFLLKDKL